MNAAPLPRIAWWLGYGGLIPFVVLSAAVVLGLDSPGFTATDAVSALLRYGAVIISFIGAVHWGVALSVAPPDKRNAMFVYSVIPALAAWLLLFFTAQVALVGMAVTVVVAFFTDQVLLFAQVHPDYRRLRLQLTVVVAASLLAAARFA